MRAAAVLIAAAVVCAVTGFAELSEVLAGIFLFLHHSGAL